jgi:hypothetical protein
MKFVEPDRKPTYSKIVITYDFAERPADEKPFLAERLVLQCLDTGAIQKMTVAASISRH